MNRQDKTLLVKSLHGRFAECESAFVISVKGLTVGQLQTLRKGVRQNGGSVQVAKNTLLKLASDGVASAEFLQPYFSQQIAVVFAKKDTPQVARLLYDAAKNIEQLSIVAGSFEGVLLDAQRVNYIATLPSREQLLAQLCAVLQGPMSAFAYTLDQVRKQREEKPAEEAK